MENSVFIKNFNNTYLYSVSDSYQKNMMDYIMKADRLYQNSDECEDLRYQLSKRQVTSDLSKILTDKHVVLMHYKAKLMPKALKVFTARDIKTDNGLRIFIDCSDFKYIDGQWRTPNIDVFVSYLVSAMTQLIYYTRPNRLVMNAGLMKDARSAFSHLFSYIIDFLYKINSIESMRNNCLYLSALYYTKCVCALDLTDSIYSSARDIAGISERQADMIHMYIDDHSFDNIKTFVELLSKVLKISQMTVDTVVEKWIYIFGSGTHFALELYTAFSSMLTDAYCGAYVNNQKTIEKVVGKDMVDYTKSLLTISRGVL